MEGDVISGEPRDHMPAPSLNEMIGGLWTFGADMQTANDGTTKEMCENRLSVTKLTVDVA